MSRRIRTTFLLLILTQGLHSTEEYLGRLWDVFLPAKLLSSAFSNDHETGFLIINFGLFIFGLWCWIFPIRKNYSFASGLIWFWIVIEMINGIVHLFGPYIREIISPVWLQLHFCLCWQFIYRGNFYIPHKDVKNKY